MGEAEFFLDETSKRGIIAQVSLWDQFDLGGSHWQVHPWVPDNNINLESEQMRNRDDFYDSVERNIEKVLDYQHRYVDKVLSITMEYDNVLYNINNESRKGKIWENYWAGFILNNTDLLSCGAFYHRFGPMGVCRPGKGKMA